MESAGRSTFLFVGPTRGVRIGDRDVFGWEWGTKRQSIDDMF